MKLKAISIIIGIIFMVLAPLETFLVINGGSILKYITYIYILILLLILIKNRYLKIKTVDTYLYLFLLAMIGSLMWTQSIGRGLDNALSIGLQVLLILLIRQCNFDDDDRLKLILSYIVGTYILVLLLLFNGNLYSSYMNRYSVKLGNTIADPNNIAALIVSAFGLLIYLKSKSKKLAVMKFIILLTMIVAILLTGSRGGVLALCGIIIYKIIQQKNIKQYLSTIVGFIVIIAILIILDYGLDVTDIVSNLLIRFEDTSGSSRIEIWMESIPLIIKKPMLGYGIGASPYIIQQSFGSDVGTHNTALTILMELGLLGFIPFILIILYILIKNDSKHGYSLKASLLGVCVSMMFFDVYNKKVLWAIIMLNLLQEHGYKKQLFLSHHSTKYKK